MLQGYDLSFTFVFLDMTINYLSKRQTFEKQNLLVSFSVIEPSKTS